MICAFQDRQISDLYDLHSLQIMSPGESRVIFELTWHMFPVLDLYSTDPVQYTMPTGIGLRISRS